MKIDINLNGNLIEYIDEEEMKETLMDEVKLQVRDNLKKIVQENKEEIKNELLRKIAKELIEDVHLGSMLKEELGGAIKNGIEKRYDLDNTFNLCYDLDLDSIVKNIYCENENEYNSILKQKIEDTLKTYIVSSYTISERIASLLVEDESYNKTLKEMLDTRICDLLDKI